METLNDTMGTCCWWMMAQPMDRRDAIRELAEKDAHVHPVIFARNFGHQIAVTAGLDYARGDAVIIIDADLQDPPEVMLDLIAEMERRI